MGKLIIFILTIIVSNTALANSGQVDNDLSFLEEYELISEDKVPAVVESLRAEYNRIFEFNDLSVCRIKNKSMFLYRVITDYQEYNFYSGLQSGFKELFILKKHNQLTNGYIFTWDISLNNSLNRVTEIVLKSYHKLQVKINHGTIMDPILEDTFQIQYDEQEFCF